MTTLHGRGPAPTAKTSRFTLPPQGSQQTPASSPIERYLDELHRRYAALCDGTVAGYIPELAKADPGWFGICIATRDGHVYETGDTRQPFTIQSISKALSYGLAIEDRGEAFILSRIGVEPSGDAFNAISLQSTSGMPFNPMINAGAIATCGQILAHDGAPRIQRILAYLSACAGRALSIDADIYTSESATGHRNRAIGWMLRNFGIIDEEPTDILETYFQQCAIQITCRDLAIIAATLANRGRNPLTHEQAIDPAHIDNILSVMSTCGMYDYSGEWIYRVGLPAKSGVCGGILAVLPGQLGIGIFSPPLDERGNSARGIKVCEDLARDLALHLFAVGSEPQSVVRLSYDGSKMSSCRRRSPHLQQTLRENAYRIRIVELQGDLIFSTVEPVVRQSLSDSSQHEFLIFNLQNVLDIDDVSLSLICQLQSSLSRLGTQMIVCDGERFSRALLRHGFNRALQFVDDDAALEHCENELLDQIIGPTWRLPKTVAFADCLLLSDLNAEELDWLDGQMSREEAPAGNYLIRAGEAGDRLYLLLEGAVEVRLRSESGALGKRVGVFEAGMCYGEMGFLDGSPRSADVVAIEHVVFRVISRELFERMEVDHSSLKIKLLEHLLHILSSNLRKSNETLSAFRG